MKIYWIKRQLPWRPVVMRMLLGFIIKMPQSDIYPNLLIDVLSILNRFTEAEDLYLKLKA
ncbi:hypothetical protein DsansV1_C21g0167591 [Dioscorea sansibarensis]